MNVSLISIAIGFGWLIALAMGLALVAMADHVGSRYAFTSLGVTRMGPTLGKTLTSKVFGNLEFSLSLGERTKENWTFIVFFDESPLSASLIPPIFQFATLTSDYLKVLIFISGTGRELSHDIEQTSYFGLFEMPRADSIKLHRDLGIRVLPYSLLLNPDAKVKAKGVINGVSHLCLLVNNAKVQNENKELDKLMTICKPFLKDVIYI